MLGLHACTIPRKQFLNILRAFHSYNNPVRHCMLQFVFVGCLRQGLSHCLTQAVQELTIYIVETVLGHGSLPGSAPSVMASE